MRGLISYIWRSAALRGVIAVGVAALLLGAGPVSAEERIPREYQLKAAFLMRFLGFIEWERAPSVGAESKQVCVLGENPFGSTLDQLSKLHGQAQSAEVTVRSVSSVADAGNCTLLYISSSERERLDSILKGLSSTGVVTVSDVDGFAQRGGMIELVLDENKVRFVINSDSARQHGIRFSSQLLALAKKLVMSGDNGLSEGYTAPA